jgi:Tfp pilus assembly protein PilW
MERRRARGTTLVEVTIVSALAMLVVLGMIGFYASSQSSWLAGSAQALAQRDATLLVETLSDSIRHACLAEPFDSPDALHQGLILRDAALNERWRFWWDAGDSCVHQGPGAGPDPDRGPVVASTVTRFQLDTLTRLVVIRLVELRGGEGQLVRMSSAAALYNRESGP